MKKYLTIVAALLFASTASAQTTESSMTISARIAFEDGDSSRRFVEVLKTGAGGGIFGGGYIDNGTETEERDIYAGAGHVIPVPGVHIEAVAFVSRTSGTEVTPTTSIVPWVLAYANVGRVIGTANYFLYAPVTKSAGVFHTLEHAKAEWDFGPALAGAGISATYGGEWTRTPFLTGTVKSDIGDFEVWAQNPTEDGRAYQVRYLRTF